MSDRSTSRAAAIHRRAGFTLIEVLVALVILSTGIVLVLRAYETALTALGRSRDALLGSQLIREKMLEVGDALRATGTWDGARDEVLSDPRYRGFRRRCDVAEVPPEGDMAMPDAGTLYEVCVTVYREELGAGREVSTLVFAAAVTNEPSTSTL